MRNPATGWFQLSTVELFLLWQAAGLGDLPDVLAVPRVGRGPAARAELTELASHALADRGLGSVDRPADDLADVLRLLDARQPGRRTFSLLADRADGPVRAVGVVGTGAAIVAVADDDVRLGPAWPGTVAEILLGSIDPLPAGDGRVANVAWPAYEQACAAGRSSGADGFLAVLRAAGLRAPDAHTLLRAVTGRSGGGELELAGRDRYGAPLPPVPSLTWIDTDTGRYAVRVRDGWLTVTPADHDRLCGIAQVMHSQRA